MKKTQKYLAAVNQAKALAIRGASNMENGRLYDRLEQAGYWWNQSDWTNAPRPRSKRVDMDGAGANPDLIEFRITAQSDKLPFINEALRKLMDVLGCTFVQQSEGYENRNQDEIEDANRRIRVYSSYIMPGTGEVNRE